MEFDISKLEQLQASRKQSRQKTFLPSVAPKVSRASTRAPKPAAPSAPAGPSRRAARDAAAPTDAAAAAAPKTAPEPTREPSPSAGRKRDAHGAPRAARQPKEPAAPSSPRTDRPRPPARSAGAKAEPRARRTDAAPAARPAPAFEPRAVAPARDDDSRAGPSAETPTKKPRGRKPGLSKSIKAALSDTSTRPHDPPAGPTLRQMIAKAWMREGELAAAERRAAREAERENRLKVLHAGLVPGEPAGDGEGERAGGGQAGGAPGDVADGLARKAFTPLVRIVDGKLALQQDTLSLHHDVERHALVRVDSDKKRLTNQSYSTRPPRDRWSLKDTELFYKALEQFGADFSLIERLFPGRTRPQIKAKYKREEKINPDRVHAAKCAAATRHAESTVTDMQWMLKTVRMAKREQAQE